MASGDHFSVRCWKQVVGAEVSGGNHTVTEGPSLFPLLWAMLCYALLDAAALSAITLFLVHRRYFLLWFGHLAMKLSIILVMDCG